MTQDTPEYELAEKRLREFHEKRGSFYSVRNRPAKYIEVTKGNNEPAMLLDKLMRSMNTLIRKDDVVFNEIIHTVGGRPVDVPDFLFFINKYEIDTLNLLCPKGNIVHTCVKGARHNNQSILHKDLMYYKLVLQYPRDDKLWQSCRYEIPANDKLNILDNTEEVIYNKNYKHIYRTFPDKS